MKKAVLDENLAISLAARFSSNEITVEAIPAEWRGLKNGRLIKEIENSEYRIFISADRKLPFEQNITGSQTAFVILSTNHLPTLEKAAELIASLIQIAEPARFAVMDRDARCYFLAIENGNRVEEEIQL